MLKSVTPVRLSPKLPGEAAPLVSIGLKPCATRRFSMLNEAAAAIVAADPPGKAVSWPIVVEDRGPKGGCILSPTKEKPE